MLDLYQQHKGMDWHPFRRLQLKTGWTWIVVDHYQINLRPLQRQRAEYNRLYVGVIKGWLT